MPIKTAITSCKNNLLVMFKLPLLKKLKKSQAKKATSCNWKNLNRLDFDIKSCWAKMIKKELK